MPVNDELARFVREALGRGLPRDAVAEALARAGWQTDEVRSALAAFAVVDFPLPVPRPRPHLSPRDAFVYLLLFTTLYIVAVNLGNLLFELIDRTIPDPIDPATDHGILAAVRWSVSSLIVAFPLFLYMSRLAARSVLADPLARSAPVRRWLTYLTLFAAACVLIGDVMTLVYNLLGGELTLRFVLKVLVVAAIAGTIFRHYLQDLRADEVATPP